MSADPHESRAGDPHPAGAATHVARNRGHWNAQSDEYQQLHGAQLDASGGMAWGVWRIPEREVRALGDVVGRDVLELGCGAAQWSIALAGAGARPVGLDLSERQLAHARRLQRAAGVAFPLVHASAEAVPLREARFDLVLSDYGATTFCDPHGFVPEAARLLRRGGTFAFTSSTPILDLCWPLDEKHPGPRLVLDYFGMHRFEDAHAVQFQLPYGEWIRLFRRSGFAIEDLIELRPAADASSSYRTDEDRAWARRWPAECLWKVRRE
jgi:SAM-dependent methyltransferase